jgi:tetratricopeptide (TPR) repeat protein
MGASVGMEAFWMRLFRHLPFILTVAAVMLLPGCQRERYPVVAKDMIPETSMYEDQSSVLVEWLRKGYKDMAVVNIDYHDDLRYVPEAKIEELRTLAENKRWDEISSKGDALGAKGLFTVSDFLYPAYRLGIIKKLYWVTPSRLLEHPDVEAGTRDLLRAFGYPEDVVDTFERDGGAVTGEILGIEVTISSIRALPRIKEPVLFTVDVDYFSTKFNKERLRELGFLRDFFLYLGGKEIEARHLSVAYSVNGGYTDIASRHLGDELASILKNPEIALSAGFPGLWMERARGYEFLREGEPELSLEEFEQALEAFGEEPSLLCGRAISLALLGRDNEAFPVLERLSEVLPEYEHAYIYIGRKLGLKGDIKRAERYLKEYLRRRPDSIDALFAYGDLLYNNERDGEALKQYLKILSRVENVDAVMYAGDALAHLGRYEEALEHYRRGLKLLDGVGYRSMRNFPEAERNIRILKQRMNKP